MKKSFCEKDPWTSLDKTLVESNIDLQRSEALIFPEAWDRSLGAGINMSDTGTDGKNTNFASN